MTGPLKSNWKPGDQMTPGDVNAMAAAINNGPSVEWQIYDEGPPELWRQRNTRTGAWIGEPKDVVAAFGVTGVVSSAMEGLVQNPESSVNGAINREATAALSAGAPGLIRQVDARGNLGLARPAWLGIVQWLINEGDTNPINFQPGDQVCPAETVEMPWTPQFLPHKMGWWDAQSLGVADGSTVLVWPDRSPQGNDLDSPKNGSGEPILTACPVMDVDKINGHHAVVADGIDDCVRGAVANPFANPFTIYAVGGTDLSDNTSGSDCMLSGQGTNPLMGAILRNTSEQYLISNSASTPASGSWTVGPKLFKAVYNGATSTLDVNGANVVSGATSTSPGNITNFTLFARGDGTTQFFPGYLGEVILVQGLVSGADHTHVMQYLNTRWSLGLTV